jgi:hypothetical protein
VTTILSLTFESLPASIDSQSSSAWLLLQTEFTCVCFLVSLSSILGVWVTLDMLSADRMQMALQQGCYHGQEKSCCH